MADDLVCVRSFAMRYEAEMAQGFLTGHNIHSLVSADDVGGMRPHMLLGSGGVQLVVRIEDQAKALEVLDSMLGTEEDIVSIHEISE